MALTSAEKQRRDRERRKAGPLSSTTESPVIAAPVRNAGAMRWSSSVRCRSMIGTVSTVSPTPCATRLGGERLQIIVEADIEAHKGRPVR